MPVPPPSMVRPPPPGYPNLSGENFCYINSILQFVMLGAEGIAPLLPPISGPPSEEMRADLRSLRQYIATCDRLANAARERRANRTSTTTPVKKKDFISELLTSDDDDDIIIPVSPPKAPKGDEVEQPPECPISKASMQAILRYYWQDCVTVHIATRKREMECLPAPPDESVSMRADADLHREVAAVKVLRLVAAGLNQEFREGEMNDAAEFFELFLTMLAEAYAPAVPATGAKRNRDDELASNPVHQYYFSRVRDSWTCPHEGCEEQHKYIEVFRHEAQIRPPASVLLEHASAGVSFGKQLAHAREVVGGNCESRPCTTCGDPVMMAMRNDTLPSGIHAVHLVWDRTRPLQTDVQSLLTTVIQDVVDFGEVYTPPPAPIDATSTTIDLDDPDEAPALPPKPAYLSVIVLFRSSHYVIARRGVLGGIWFIVNDKHNHLVLGSEWDRVVGYILANNFSPLLLGYCFEDVPVGTAPSILPPPPYRSSPHVFDSNFIGQYRRQLAKQREEERHQYRSTQVSNNNSSNNVASSSSSSPNSAFKHLEDDEAQAMRLARDMSDSQIDIVMSVIEETKEPFAAVARALSLHNWNVSLATNHLRSSPELSELLAPPKTNSSPISQLLSFGKINSPRRAAQSNIMTSPNNNSLPPELLAAGSGAGRAQVTSRLSSAVPKKHLSSYTVFLYMRPTESVQTTPIIKDYGGTVISPGGICLSPSVIGIVDLNHLERMITNMKGKGKRPIPELFASVAARKRMLFTPEAVQALVDKENGMGAMYDHLVPQPICKVLAEGKDVPLNKVDEYIDTLLQVLGSEGKGGGAHEGWLSKYTPNFMKR